MKLFNVSEKGLKTLFSKKTILILIILIFLAGCTIQGKVIQSPSLEILSLKTDKDLYHSGEIINITADVSSPVNLDNVKVRFYGIYSRTYRLDKTETISPNQGENTITTAYTAPRCYGCSGISPGTYQISVDVVYNNQTLASSSKDIEIRQ